MQNAPLKYDVAIVGGGLAGLSAAIQLSKAGYSVILFEKEKFPFHKVCGEYVSLESWDFLQALGLQLNEMNLPVIDALCLTAPDGKSFITKLPLGGFGISRYLLDESLAKLALEHGVILFEETKVENIVFDNDFTIQYKCKNGGNNEIVNSVVCLAAYGKRSNLDAKWKRSFLKGQSKQLDNYVAIKYHIKTEWKENIIGVHNFENGYCGISKIEDNKFCLCYMTNAQNFKKSNNNIQQLEKEILYKNPILKKILSDCKMIEQFPITISQINFNKKTQIENHVMMLGDAAGMITPLCGNGMSIALNSSKIAASLVIDFLNNKISRKDMERNYRTQWLKTFASRLQTGRLLQRFFGKLFLTNVFVRLFKTFPFLATPVIKKTHGKPF
ncbi:MAG: FAD-dependent oxidoreductase [Chitinophagaceae bacterium]